MNKHLKSIIDDLKQHNVYMFGSRVFGEDGIKDVLVDSDYDFFGNLDDIKWSLQYFKDNYKVSKEQINEHPYYERSYYIDVSGMIFNFVTVKNGDLQAWKDATEMMKIVDNSVRKNKLMRQMTFESILTLLKHQYRSSKIKRKSR